MKEPIGVLGAGWVGLVTAACFADLGHEVILRDIEEARITELQAGRIPIYEPNLVELVDRNRERLRFTTRSAAVFERAKLAFVSVGTPSTYSGDADLSSVWRVINELPDSYDGLQLVMKSTVPPGTGERVRAWLDARGLAHVGYVSNPEFLAEGTAVANFMRPDRIVVGAFRSEEGDRVAALYESLGAPIVRTDVTSAEMIKSASNAFLATKISFINEIANVCEQVGADVSLVAGGMGLDERIGPHFLRAGIGYGGSCFPKDVAALKQLAGNSGYHFQLLTSVIEVNELQKRRVVTKLRKHLGSLHNRTVTLLGLAFKPGTNDVREASSLVLAMRLLAEGARVKAWDPVAVEEARPHLPGVDLYEDLLEAVSGADAAVIVTEWNELTAFPRPEVHAAMKTPLVVDGRNLLDPESVQLAGFTYEGVGRPAAPVEERLAPQPSELDGTLANAVASAQMRAIPSKAVGS
jgi:UDPglucose 6-dehydrogenase